MQTREAFDFLTQKALEKQQEFDSLSALRDALQTANAAEEKTKTATASLATLTSQITAAEKNIADTNAKYDALIEQRKADYKAASEKYAAATKQAQADADAIAAEIVTNIKANQAALATTVADAEAKKSALTTEIAALTNQRDAVKAELSAFSARVAVATGAGAQP